MKRRTPSAPPPAAPLLLTVYSIEHGVNLGQLYERSTRRLVFLCRGSMPWIKANLGAFEQAWKRTERRAGA